MDDSNVMTVIVKMFQASNARLRDDIEKLKADLDKDPAYALSWSLDAFKAAALLNAQTGLLQRIEADDTCDVEALIKIAQLKANESVKYPSFSSSPCANTMHVCQGAAWALLVETLIRYRGE